MRLASVFLSGMRSAYEVLPEQTKHKAHFIKTAEVTVINFNADEDLRDSWKQVAGYQKKSFNQLNTKNIESLKIYDCYAR